MRVGCLELVRFGMFTDRKIDLPPAERDFHVIVGPNEAGKSTLREAILNLLYGIPKNTTYAFLYPMPDLRLGGIIHHDGNTLAFQRIKGNKQTLRTPLDSPLPDGALGLYLGTTDRDFFSQMFGLDHERLVAGGHSILSASDDLGQILFQSAAGIANLGKVRESLEAEADKLWARQKSGKRDYYIAAEAYAAASVALKNATVRAKDWAERESALASLEEAMEEAKKSHAVVKARRNLLERVRRVKPHLNTLDDLTAQLLELRDVQELPDSAAQTVIAAQRDAAAAAAAMEQHLRAEKQAQTAREGIVIDNRILERSAEVTDLNERRLQYRVYERDIARREAEVNAQWSMVVGLAEQLGWNAKAEDAIQSRIPPVAVRVLLERLIRNHGTVFEVLKAAERAEGAKAGELVRAEAALAALQLSEPPVGLQVALAQAQRLGDFEATLRDRQAVVAQREAARDAAHAALGTWRGDLVALRGVTIPPSEVIEALTHEQRNDAADEKVVSGRVDELVGQVEKLQVEIKQYRETHTVVPREELLGAREARDLAWIGIKANSLELQARANNYERLVREADSLSDTRHESAQQTSELQSKQQQRERLQVDLETARARVQTLKDAAASRAAKWSTLARECGLPDITFQAARAWIDARAVALKTSNDLDDAHRSLGLHVSACESARVTLTRELANAGTQTRDEPLSVLILVANRVAQAAAAAKGESETLSRQVSEGRHALTSLRAELSEAKVQVEQWTLGWTQALKLAGLAPDSEIGSVEGALEVFKRMDAALASMQKIRVERIEAMRADLAAQTEAARGLAGRIAPDLVEKAADEIVLQLVNRLRAAEQARDEAERQRRALELAQTRIAETKAQQAQAQAAMKPLLDRARVSTIPELTDAIARSDERRRLRDGALAAEKALRDAGDGLPIDQLRAEAAKVDLGTLTIDLGELASQDEGLVKQLTELAAQKQEASAALAAIGDSAEAAKAEAQRQEALAGMADAVERYVKVHTAARLLKWSVDQYREEKRDPMLSLASDVFSRLTLGSFERLTVDFDDDPPKLQGRRPNGTLVEVEGMSEGARDQLYLALRLAALDMHLGQAHVLPFVADDLFINFDDGRSKAGLEALRELSKKTQVLFLTHHEHLVPLVQEVFGKAVNVVDLSK